MAVRLARLDMIPGLRVTRLFLMRCIGKRPPYTLAGPYHAVGGQIEDSNRQISKAVSATDLSSVQYIDIIGQLR